MALSTEPVVPRDGPTPATGRSLRWIVAAGALLILVFVAATGYDTWRAYRQVLADTDRELGNLANALADQGASSLLSVDILLRDTANWYVAVGHEVARERADTLLARRTARLPQVRTLEVVDANGIRRHSSRALPEAPAIDVSDRSYFVAQRASATTGLFVSEPIMSDAEDRMAFVLSRRIDSGPGQFVGIVSAVIDLDGIRRLYRSITLSAGSAINLVRDDGTLIVRHPSTPWLTERKFPELAATLRSGASGGRLATLVARRPGETKRFVAIARLRDLPLSVAITRDSTVALKSWGEEIVRVGVRTVAIAALGVLLIGVFVRQLRRVNAGEQALRKSEERYALAMEGSQEGHWDWDLASDRLFLSPKMKALHGRPEGEPVVTRTEWYAQLEIEPDDKRRLDEAQKDHIDGHTPYYELEYRIRHRDGGWHWLLARGRCLRDAMDQPYRFVGSASDITDRKRAESERETLQARLRQAQKLEAMGTLAGGIAHDFNNILGAILGYGELAQRASGEGSRVRSYLDHVMHAGGRAKALVERILAFSRTDLAEREPVHVQSVVSETLELLAASLPPGVRLERRLWLGDAAVIGDATQLHQVVMNLCANAIHAMSDGGVLGVSLERAKVAFSRAVSHGALPAGPYVRLMVSDTGTGISPSVLERIFDPFFTTKVVGEGTGLGLPLVHGIVGDLGGAIDIQTQPGEGTTFAIWLPLAGETMRPLPKAARQAPLGNGETVMIVDDEPALVALAEEMLAELGYEPVGFGSSSAALQAFRADPQRFDLVLTDEAMPELTGTALAREIRSVDAETPVVLMSGFGGAPLAARAADAGVNEVLRKPLHSRDIADSLSRALGAARSACHAIK